jgi:hypothetical protein
MNNENGKNKSSDVSRRDFLSGVTVGAAGLAAVGASAYVAAPRPAHAAITPKGKIPDKPFLTGISRTRQAPRRLWANPA